MNTFLDLILKWPKEPYEKKAALVPEEVPFEKFLWENWEIPQFSAHFSTPS